MEQISRLTFCALDGTPPPELELGPLPPADRVRMLCESAFLPFLVRVDANKTLENNCRDGFPNIHLHFIYVYGHAWLTPDGPQSAVTVGGESVMRPAAERLAQLITPTIGVAAAVACAAHRA